VRHARIVGRTHRLINSRYPTVGVFDDIARDADDLRAAIAIEALTNDRLTMANERLARLPDGEIVSGAGATLVMAAFLHADEAGGRFTDGTLGGWYAALEIDTAIAETLYHHTRRLRLSRGGFPARMDIRELVVKLNCDLVDVRGRTAFKKAADYSASQAFGVGLRNGRVENGIVFDSVRKRGGTNVCLLWPSKVPLPVVQAGHYQYQWDGLAKVTVSKITGLT
jgi:RES domain